MSTSSTGAHIRSYVIRAGRMTSAQLRALERLEHRYEVKIRGDRTPGDFYRVSAPLFVEVGFGNGEALLAMAEAHPERNYLGIEVHPPGVGRLLSALETRGLENVRVSRRDAVEVFRWLPERSLDGVYIWFPDPWPKRRHQKRRLVQAPFLDVLARTLKPGGVLHMATDWHDYAEQMLRVAEAEPGLANRAGPGHFVTGPTERPRTHFQRRGERLGHGVWDLVFERRKARTRP